MSNWRKEFHDHLIDSFLDPNVLFGSFCFYTIIGLLIAFIFGTIDNNKIQALSYLDLFKTVSLSQTAFGLINGSSRLNVSREYYQLLSEKRPIVAFEIIKTLFFIIFTTCLFRIFITFWFSLMVYPIVSQYFLNFNQF